MRLKPVVLSALVVLSAVCLGQWSEPVGISDTAFSRAQSVALASGSGDTLWAICQSYDTGIGYVICQWSMGDSWSGPETLAKGDHMWDLSTGVDPQGCVWLAWSRAIAYTIDDSFGIYTCVHDSSGWGGPRLAIPFNFPCYIGFAADKDGHWYMGLQENVVISLTNYSSALYARFQGDTWAVGAIGIGTSDPYPYYVDYGRPTLVLRPDGGLWAVYWRAAYNEETKVLIDHLVPFETLSHCAVRYDLAAWSARGDSAGQMWIVFADTLGAVWSSTYDTVGERDRRLVTTDRRSGPGVCADAMGWVWAFWARSDTSLVASCNWGNNWSEPEVVTSKTGYPVGIVSDQHGRIYVCFRDTQGKYWSCYRTSRPGVRGDAAVKRPVVGRGASVVRVLPPDIVVFDAMGRRVANPRSGVFFIRDEGSGAGDMGRTRKVVIPR